MISAPPVSLAMLASAFKKDPCGAAIFRDVLTDEEVECMLRALLGDVYEDKVCHTALDVSIRTTDGRFRALLGHSLANGLLGDEISMIAESGLPVALMWGENDAFINSDYYWQVAIQRPLGDGKYAVSGAGHSPHLSDSKQFVELLEKLVVAADL